MPDSYEIDTELVAATESLIWANLNGQAVDPPSELVPGLDLKCAYVVQAEVVKRELMGSMGRDLAGIKVGLADPEGRSQAGLSEPIFGVIYAEKQNDAKMLLRSFIAPRVEAEIAVRLNKSAPKIDSLHLAIEIADSRIGWRGSIPDIVADRSAAGTFLLGPGRSPDALERIAENPVSVRGSGIEGSVKADRERLVDTILRSAEWARANDYDPGGKVVLTGNLFPAVEARSGAIFSVSCPSLGAIRTEFG